MHPLQGLRGSIKLCGIVSWINQDTKSEPSTISNTTSFPNTLTAARSTSKSLGLMSRSTFRCFSAETADISLLASVVSRFPGGTFDVDLFHPNCMTAESACEAEFTARIAESLFSSGEGALRFPFASEMVRPSPSRSASWSAEIVVVETFTTLRLVVAI